MSETEAEAAAEVVPESRPESRPENRPENRPESSPETIPDLSPEQRQFLDQEANHFFEGEMAHEQRAAWLLALASGLLIALWRLLSTSLAAEMNDLAFVLMIATLLALVAAVGVSLWALWPLGGGKRPTLLRPWRGREVSNLDRPADSSDPTALPPVPERFRGSISTIVWYHYIAHRRRAEIKGRRVVWITLTLVIGLLLGTAGILATLLEPAW